MKIAVTGAFGYSGKYITYRLLEAGHQVLTLTNSLKRANPFGERIEISPFHFDEPEKLTQALAGVDALINTYWVRFDHKLFSHHEAVANTLKLFNAAKAAGVKRIVHVSITHPDINSNMPYFKGKAELEEALEKLGVSYCILRPTVLFGKEDILINNIAWSLRHLPVFGLFGKGDYKLQPIYVDDLAAAAVEQATRPNPTSEILNAIGPETFTYRELVTTIKETLDLHRPIIGLPSTLAYWFSKPLGYLVGDVIVTRYEIQGLMENRLFVEAPPLGPTKLTAWITEHKDSLGRRYTSEIARRKDRVGAYRSN